jgi:DNA-directed RNA polymerase subunit N (RpoN/RPB10)
MKQVAGMWDKDIKAFRCCSCGAVIAAAPNAYATRFSFGFITQVTIGDGKFPQFCRGCAGKALQQLGKILEEQAARELNEAWETDLFGEEETG